MLPANDDLTRYLQSAFFDPIQSLQIANERLRRQPGSGEAHLLAFMSHAELLVTTLDDRDRTLAKTHYEKAVALNSRLSLFPTTFIAEELIGVGGFSYVFKVTKGASPMALKVFKRCILISDATWETFTETLERLGRCRSPYIVAVLEILKQRTSQEQSFFYVNEYVDGQSLRRWLQRRPNKDASPTHIPLTWYLEVLTIGSHIAKGLKAAHDCDVLHLDLKPENVLIEQTPDGVRAKLIDFNFVTLQRSGIATLSFRPLQTSFRYMAPEAIDKIDRACGFRGMAISVPN